MTRSARLLIAAVVAIGLAACEKADLEVSDGTGPNPTLPKPESNLIPTVNVAEAVGWPEGTTPVAAKGLKVSLFADGLDHPRWIYVLPNGDVLVAETNAPADRPKDNTGIRGWFIDFFQRRAGAQSPSADRITLFRDADGDGSPETRAVFLKDLNSPFGMVLVGSDFYVANTDAIVRFPYQEGTTAITAEGTKVVDLPAGLINHHWTKNVIASPDGSRLYATVGSNSNAGDHGMEAETGRAAIWEIDPKTGLHKVYASGLRNPNGLDYEPETGVLWVAVNERDEIGSDLVPDYMTSVQAGGFYGWPYSYFGQHVDERVRPPRPDLVEKAIVPDYALGPHTASLGFTFAEGARLPEQYMNGAFIGQHGSWNRVPHSGYKVIFVPFSGGKPSGPPIDVLTGFLTEDGKARGRPVGVAIDKQGALLVADDAGNRIWRVTSASTPAEPSPPQQQQQQPAPAPGQPPAENEPPAEDPPAAQPPPDQSSPPPEPSSDPTPPL